MILVRNSLEKLLSSMGTKRKTRSIRVKPDRICPTAKRRGEEGSERREILIRGTNECLFVTPPPHPAREKTQGGGTMTCVARNGRDENEGKREREKKKEEEGIEKRVTRPSWIG